MAVTFSTKSTPQGTLSMHYGRAMAQALRLSVAPLYTQTSLAKTAPSRLNKWQGQWAHDVSRVNQSPSS